jgi:hypothetical protein
VQCGSLFFEKKNQQVKGKKVSWTFDQQFSEKQRTTSDPEPRFSVKARNWQRKNNCQFLEEQPPTVLLDFSKTWNWRL